MAKKSTKAKRSTQGPFVLWHGMNFSRMLRFLAMRPPLHWSRAPRLALLPPLTLYNSMMSTIEDLVYRRAVRRTEIEQPPVFILGFWRSGTTLLHNLITRDPQFSFPNTYQMLFPTHFLLTENPGKQLTGFLVPKTRPMDNVKAGWEYPQECEFALATMTLLSPYLLTAFSHDYSIYLKTFDFEGASEEEVQEWKESMMWLVQKLTYRNPKPLVLKSPAHTYRVPYLLDLFPNARFLYIYRNPYDVFNSCVHLRKTMVRENELGRTPLLGHEEEAIRTYKQGFDCYQRDKHLIPEGNLHELRFEDLEVDPLGELEKAYAGLGLNGFDQLRQIIEPEVPALRRYRKNKFDDDPEWGTRVYNELREAFEALGYDPPEAAQRPAA